MWNKAIVSFFGRRAWRFDNPLDWWADVLNVTKGNLQPLIDSLKAEKIPAKDITKLFYRLRKEVVCESH